MFSREGFIDAYNKLNPKQKEAVDTIDGPVMVIAGPGTGKTQILTLRIAKILEETDANPENILALTFTNSGVHAMRKKLLLLIGDEAYRVGIYTFHSFAESIIREFSFYFSELEFATVIGDLEKVKILEDILKNGDYTELTSLHDTFRSLRQINDAIGDIKSEGISPAAFEELLPAWKKQMLDDDSIVYKKKYKEFNAGDIKPSELLKIEKKIARAYEVADIFAKYQKHIQESGLYDFSDMILTVLRELEKNENLKLDIQEKYQYLLVDEHQDTNEGQNRLIELLTDAPHLGGRPNVFTVGDEKQSIYRFQGASSKTFNHFTSLYNDVKIISLEKNYRSPKHVLDASHTVISNTLSNEVELATDKKDNDKVRILEFSSYKFELLYIAKDIQEKIESGVDPNDIAVIYRSNRHIDDIKTVFSLRGISHSVFSKDNLFEDRNISNIITLLKVIHNPADNYHLGRALLIDFLQLDAYESVRVLQKFHTESRKGGVSLFDILSREDEYKAFTNTIKKLKTRSANSSFGIFFKEFLNDIGYFTYMLQSATSRDQLLKIDTLYDEIKRQSRSNHLYALDDFIAFVDSYQKYNLAIETGDVKVTDGVACMTAHRSKGLEFSHVYIVNATRNNWEKSRGFGGIALPLADYKGGVDDERRLFYVAMTRAKETLTITSALADWEGRERERSQFISEIGTTYRNDIDTASFEKKHIDDLSLFIQTSTVKESVFDVEYLRKLFLEKSLSVTALNNYLRCENKYLFRNLIRLPSEYSPFLLFGDIVHQSLEKFFEESKNSNKILPVLHLQEHFTAAMEHASLFGQEYKKYLDRGLEILARYHERYHAEWLLTISNEKRVKQQLQLADGTPLTLYGIVDKIEYLDSETNGRINIVDYKTGKAFSDKSDKRQKEDLERQLVFYHLLMEKYHDGVFTIEKAVLDFIERNKKGVFEQHTVAVTEKDVMDLRDTINTMADDVLSGAFLAKGCQEKDCEFCTLRRAVEDAR